MAKSAEMNCSTLFASALRNGLTLSATANQLQAAVGKWFWGISCKDHENNKQQQGGPVKSVSSKAGTQIGVPICFTECPQLSSLAAELWIPCCPLRVKNSWKQSVTHTHTTTAPNVTLANTHKDKHDSRQGTMTCRMAPPNITTTHIIPLRKRS